MLEALKTTIASLTLKDVLWLEASKMSNLFGVALYHITVDLDNVRQFSSLYDLTMGSRNAWLIVLAQGQRLALLSGVVL